MVGLQVLVLAIEVRILVPEQHMNTNECLFCRIIQNRTEKFVYEDDSVVVLLSKFQTSEGHILVMLKEHYESIDSIPDKDYLHLQSIVKKYNKKLNTNFKAEKIYLILLAEEISHVHFQLIPRYPGNTKGPAFLTENIKEVKNPENIIEKINSVL